MGKNKSRKPKDWRAKKRANPAWEDIKKENALLEQYYRTQRILPEDEWETFMKYCRKDLPSTFRITKIRGHASDLLRSLRDGYISKISAEDIKLGNDVSAVAVENADEEENEQDLLLEPIKWYPEELAWNSNLSRRFLRRSEILRKLHRFLVEDSECGAISRQEAVSMIPPMLLDVKPHHKVLDMCAAPGSKTSQLIEMMHGVEGDELPTGVVVANDADHKRCYLLTHQAKRLKSHCVMVTNHDASIFPKLYSRHRDGEQEGELMEFDRVLCDVPCSGDGTIRKNPLLWVKWTPHLGVSLHGLQIRILIRGLELLKVGGRLVYSTCSFNPIENEAVIATVLSKSEGSVKLLDCSDKLPELKRRPGMKKWSVFAKDGKEYKCMDDVDAKPSFGYKDTMFPLSAEETEKLNLQHCMRVFPQDQNTGGFFIAAFEKNDELPWQKAKKFRYQKKMPWDDSCGNSLAVPDPAAKDEKGSSELSSEPLIKDVVDENGTATGYTIEDPPKLDDLSSSPPRKKFRQGMIKEAPYIFLDENDKELGDIRKFYGMSSELPSSQFMIRDNEGKKRHIYLVSTDIQKIISLNTNLKIINTGLKVMSRSAFDAGANENQGMSYRLVQDGAHLMSRYIRERIVEITHADLIALLTYGDYNTDKLDVKTRERLSSMTMGCVLWHYQPSKETCENGLSAEIWLCGHYGHKVVQCMVTKEEKKHFLRLLGAEIPNELEEKVKGPSWGDTNVTDKGESAAIVDDVTDTDVTDEGESAAIVDDVTDTDVTDEGESAAIVDDVTEVNDV